MSWIGGSISSLTGQLSNLTKDILTEGTEEIDDPTTELRLAKEKIEHLDVLLSTQRHENERLKRINKELEEKAESSELQINAISREYRGVLEGKEKDFSALKQQHQELLEQQAQSAALSLPSRNGALALMSSSPVPYNQDNSQNFVSSVGGGEDKFGSFNYDEDHGDWDFDGSIRLQRENNNLRAELQKLQSEVKHWRSVAAQLGQNAVQGSDQHGPSAGFIELKRQIENLEAQLGKNREEMQQQATSLHEHHRQKVSHLKSGHKVEIDSLESRHQSELDLLKAGHKVDIESLHGQLTSLGQQLADVRDGVNGSQHSGSFTLPESDRLDSKEVELQRRLIEALSEKNKFQDACSHLESLLEELQQKIEHLQQQQRSHDVPGDEDLQRKVTELTQHLQESEALRLDLEKEIDEVRKDQVATKYRLLDQLDANHADAQEVLSELRELRDNMGTETNYRRHELRTERWTLVNQLFRVGQQKNQLTQSLQSVKKEQEIVLAKTEASIEKLGDEGQQDITAELFDTLEKENLLLKNENLKLEEQLHLLEKAASTNAAEKQALLHRAQDLRSQLRNLTGEADFDTSDTDDLDLLSDDSVSASDSRNAALYVRKEDVEKELVSLRAQLSGQALDASALEMETTDWLLEREALEDVITDLRKHSQEQEQEIRSLKSGKASGGVSQGSEHSIDLDTSGKFQDLEAEISSLREEKIELEDALEELDTQHCQAQEQLIKQRDHLMSQLAEHTAQIQQQQEEIDQLNNVLTQLRENQEMQQSAGVDGEFPQEQDQILLEGKCKQLEADISEVKSEHKSSISPVEKEIADLREKIHNGGLVINDLHMDKQELEEELKSSQSETAAKVAKIKEMREAQVMLEKDKKILEEKVLEMEDRLSEMEEEVEKWQQVNEVKQVQQMSTWKDGDEVESLKSRVAAMEKEKFMFSLNFNSLSSEQPTSDYSFEDAAFRKVLEEETKVRKKIEEDSHVILKLRGEVKKLYENKQRLKLDLHELRRLHEAGTSKVTQLENELKESKALLDSALQEKAELEMKLDQEQESVALFKFKISDAVGKLEELSKRNEELSNRLFTAEEENSDLIGQIESKQQQHDHSIQELESRQQDDIRSKEIQHQKVLDSQRDLIVSLQAEVNAKTNLEGMLEVKSQKVEELSNKMRSFKQEFDSLQTEITTLEDLCGEKDKEIGELKARLLHCDENLTIEEKHSQQLTMRDEELQLLRSRNVLLESSLSHVQNDLGSAIKDQQFIQQQNESILNPDVDVEELKHEIEKLKNQASEDQHLHETIFELEAELTACNDKIVELHKDLAHTNETIKCQNASISDLNAQAEIYQHQLQQAEAEVKLLKSNITVLEQTSIDKENNLSEIETKMASLLALLTDQQKEHIRNDPSVIPDISPPKYKHIPAIGFLEESSMIDSVSIEKDEKQQTKLGTQSFVNEKAGSEMNGNGPDDDFDSSASDRDRFAALEQEVDELRVQLKEKEAVVAELQRSSSYLIAMLEKDAGALDNSLSNQMTVHKVEAELRGLRAEREQMMAVVTEKSRENSSLKSELHRLMDVVSAGQAAINKLQHDNRSLEQRKHSPPREDGEDDMRREALSNMARLVRDRETEIEALRQKNETLLAVLQESGESQAAAHLVPLLRDKEILLQQVSCLTSEREQLITCVTQKHSESLAYHAEMQRLTAVLVESQATSEKIRNDYSALIPAFEDKSQSLLTAQNELIKYKQKLTDLEVRHGELIQRSSSQDSPGSTDLSSLENELERLRNIESDLRTTLSQQDEKIHMLTHRNSTLEENLNAKDTECALLRKQMENSKYQITDLLTEVSNMKAEREQIHHKTNVQNTESASLRESYNRMCLEAREKDIEVSSLKEQVMTLTSLLNEQQGEHGQVTKLMRENEAAVAAARQLQQERDQHAMMAEHKSQECGALRNEVAYLKEKEFRLTKELERLRAHLLEIEEGFTKDALEAEEREKDLRNKLAVAEEQWMSSSFQVEASSKESRHQIESMQLQLQHVASQRDSAYMQVANMQEQCQQYATSLGNLQLVLEHFQKEKDSAIAIETERLQNECKVLRVEVKELRTELQATRGDLTEALDGLEAASRLSEQLDRKEEALAALKEEVQLREQGLNAAEGEIRKLNSSTEAKVDKTLMHNMVMTWLLSPENKQLEIVHLMGNILSFSPDDFLKIETAQKKGGLLSGLFRRASTAPASPVRQTQANQSFSQLFVKFLEEESSPPPTPVRLPAEAMAAETQHRHKPTFNPFMAPRHVTQDGRRSSTPSSHILMSPDSPTSTPLFSPLTSIPSSTESAILKDVLGNR